MTHSKLSVTLNHGRVICVLRKICTFFFCVKSAGNCSTTGKQTNFPSWRNFSQILRRKKMRRFYAEFDVAIVRFRRFHSTYVVYFKIRDKSC